MAYIKSGSATDIPAETVAAMAQLVGLAIPPRDIPELAGAIRDQFASIALLETLDLTDIMPAIEFDPRWEDGDDASR